MLDPDICTAYIPGNDTGWVFHAIGWYVGRTDVNVAQYWNPTSVHPTCWPMSLAKLMDLYNLLHVNLQYNPIKVHLLLVVLSDVSTSHSPCLLTLAHCSNCLSDTPVATCDTTASLMLSSLMPSDVSGNKKLLAANTGHSHKEASPLCPFGRRSWSHTKKVKAAAAWLSGQGRWEGASGKKHHNE
ncbi:hypothetical protein CRENBAI_011193 [Crenichthys baileyi]|uniref:Uncharacterized protein n=1 Tax=Crenichthys baileyi TaxID=28760 RepID=A0AAV9S4Y2_9TELE